jgi:hypothetical protein
MMDKRKMNRWAELMARRRRITVYVEEQPYTRQYGMTVEGALIAHDQRLLDDVREGRAWVVDARGARVGLGGTLEDGIHLYIRYADEGESG